MTVRVAQVTGAVALVLLIVLSHGQPVSGLQWDPPVACADCDGWNAPQAPFRVFGNTYYVGVSGLSAILIDAGSGLILLDGGLPQSAPLIDANIRQLGFRTEDIRLITASHEHFDHVGGIAALQRTSGALVAASARAAEALRRGHYSEDDPQFALGHPSFPVVENVRIVADGDTLHVGTVELTAHLTPGHTPGSTTWSWRACEAERCLDVVYADSLNPVSAPGFRFTGDARRPSVVESFRESLAKVEKLPCDIIVGVHPGFTGLASRVKQRAMRAAGDADPFVDPDGCRNYAASFRRQLDSRIAEEQRR